MINYCSNFDAVQLNNGGTPKKDLGAGVGVFTLVRVNTGQAPFSQALMNAPVTSPNFSRFL